MEKHRPRNTCAWHTLALAGGAKDRMCDISLIKCLFNHIFDGWISDRDVMDRKF